MDILIGNPVQYETILLLAVPVPGVVLVLVPLPTGLQNQGLNSEVELRVRKYSPCNRCFEHLKTLDAANDGCNSHLQCLI